MLGCMLKTFADVVSFMEDTVNLERQTDHYTTRTYRLDRMRALLDHFGHPERSYRVLHAAGSKGKGSTCRYLAAGLEALGYRTGLYLSPHLTDCRERFLVDGRFAPDEMLVSTGNEMADGLRDFTFRDDWGESRPTTFELYTLFAFLLYRDAGCQWAVLETGLGGRLDATNTVDPEAAILCPIELEHTKILGSTIEAIATEKSKIIRPGKPVFVGRVDKTAMDVFRKEAASCHSPLFALAEEAPLIETETTFQGEKTRIVWKDGSEDRLLLRMIGKIQGDNAALALLTLKKLGLFDSGKTLPALEAATLPGRMEKISEGPDIWLDGAHTVNSLRALFESFAALYPERGRRVALYGALIDKNHIPMCRLVAENFDHVIVSTPGTRRRSDIHAIWEMLKADSPGGDIRLVPDTREAVREARRTAGPGGAVLVCGSFYLAGAVKEVLAT